MIRCGQDIDELKISIYSFLSKSFDKHNPLDGRQFFFGENDVTTRTTGCPNSGLRSIFYLNSFARANFNSAKYSERCHHPDIRYPMGHLK